MQHGDEEPLCRYIAIGAVCMVLSLIPRLLTHLPISPFLSSSSLSSSSIIIITIISFTIILIHHHFYHHQTHNYLFYFLHCMYGIITHTTPIYSPFHELGIQGMIAEVHLRRIERLTVSTVQVSNYLCVTYREYALIVCSL